MRQLVLLFLIASACFYSWGQNQKELKKEVKAFQKDLRKQYRSKEDSPLRTKVERREFKGHKFYKYDPEWVVNASYEVISSPDTIVMPTSAGTTKKFLKYAKIAFVKDSVSCVFYGYRNVKYINHEEYGRYLFIPFTDATSGTETYGGGRYLDIEMPSSNAITINFNLAYNPYCAYATGWFCPIPPRDNDLKVSVRAGIRGPETH